jgi:DNA invertase Pin-like site-specific DNA recombinase
MRTAIYMRVSTETQDLDAQEQAISVFLTQKGIKDEIRYADQAYSGSNMERPQFKQLLIDIKQGKVERLIVWKLDRLSRKLKELIKLLDDFKEYNVKVISVHENIDMTTPHGIAMVHMIGVFAQLERDMGIERTKAGIAASRAKGTKWGAPIKIGNDIKEKIRNLRSIGMSYRLIGKKLGISSSTVFFVIKENKAKVLNQSAE